MAFLEPLSSTTLSLKYRPGRDEFFAPTSSESVFTFGDYRINRSDSYETLSGTPLNLSFGPFSTLENLGVDQYTDNLTRYVKPQELNLPPEDPKSYSYFASFYTEVANAINNIIDNFPYAIVCQSNSISNSTIYDYDETINLTSGTTSSTFKIKLSTFLNYGAVPINSGDSANQISLIGNYDKFAIQLSNSGYTEIYNLKKATLYRNSTNPNYSYIEFNINSSLGITGTTTSQSVYIRPTRARTAEFTTQLQPLEKHLLYDGKLIIPDVENEGQNKDVEITYTWPKSLDGYNPDNRGDDFDTYKDSILEAANYIDEIKTNIFLKTVIPENYTELDSDDEIYTKMVQTYAHEFDKIKKYIDSMAYAHSIEYSGNESVPDKFIQKLSNLLGWKFKDSFNEIDLFEYLVGDQDTMTNSYTQFNVEIWKRILINVVWLFKKKGTRDALTFIFKLIGAPDCLIELNEFVYDIERVVSSTSPKVNNYGYINYDSSLLRFQEGGDGRGTGDDYINQWRPEFNPTLREDNIKVYTGSTETSIVETQLINGFGGEIIDIRTTEYLGTQPILNTKEADFNISPARALECDVFAYYQENCTCYQPVLSASTCPSFSSTTVPSYITNALNCSTINPTNISAMTLTQYINFLYTSNINPRNRKTNVAGHNTWHYPELKNIYFNYYLMTNPQSNQITIGSLENYLHLLEVQFRDYILQLLPATTILNTNAVIYRNPLFHTQKFVYKRGLNDGSEFRTSLNLYDPQIYGPQIDSTIDLGVTGNVPMITINPVVVEGVNQSINAFTVSAPSSTVIDCVLYGYNMSALTRLQNISLIEQV